MRKPHFKCLRFKKLPFRCNKKKTKVILTFYEHDLMLLGWALVPGSSCVATHAQCLVGVWFSLSSPPPPSIEAFQYVSRMLVKLNLMHTCITEQKNVLLALILGYMLVLHYPSWVLNWVTELAVCWGKPDVCSKKTIVMGSELSLKSASNSSSVSLSLFSPKMRNKKRK